MAVAHDSGHVSIRRDPFFGKEFDATRVDIKFLLGSKARPLVCEQTTLNQMLPPGIVLVIHGGTSSREIIGI